MSPNALTKSEDSTLNGALNTGWEKFAFFNRRNSPFDSEIVGVTLLLIAPTHEGMTRPSWAGWLVTCRDGRPCRPWVS